MWTDEKIEGIAVCKCWLDSGGQLPPYPVAQLEAARECVLAAINALEAQHFSFRQQ